MPKTRATADADACAPVLRYTRLGRCLQHDRPGHAASPTIPQISWSGSCAFAYEDTVASCRRATANRATPASYTLWPAEARGQHRTGRTTVLHVDDTHVHVQWGPKLVRLRRDSHREAIHVLVPHTTTLDLVQLLECVYLLRISYDGADLFPSDEVTVSCQVILELIDTLCIRGAFVRVSSRILGDHVAKDVPSHTPRSAATREQLASREDRMRASE